MIILHLSRGFELTKKFLPLILIPIIMDVLQITDIYRRVRDFNIKFTVPTAIPSLTQVLADPPAAGGGGFTINMPFAYLGGIAFLLFILYIVVGAFLKGGYLGSVLTGIQGGVFSTDEFIKYGKVFFGRFLLQNVITFLALMLILPIGMLFGPLIILVFIGLLFLFFYLLFWDYAMVVEDLGVIEGAQTSLNIVKDNSGKVFTFILPIVLVTALFSVLVNALAVAGSFLILIAIIAYGYFGTGIVFTMMSFYNELTEN
jgi:hypothetical protein